MGKETRTVADAPHNSHRFLVTCCLHAYNLRFRRAEIAPNFCLWIRSFDVYILLVWYYRLFWLSLVGTVFFVLSEACMTTHCAIWHKFPSYMSLQQTSSRLQTGIFELPRSIWCAAICCLRFAETVVWIVAAVTLRFRLVWRRCCLRLVWRSCCCCQLLIVGLLQVVGATSWPLAFSPVVK